MKGSSLKVRAQDKESSSSLPCCIFSAWCQKRVYEFLSSSEGVGRNIDTVKLMFTGRNPNKPEAPMKVKQSL